MDSVQSLPLISGLSPSVLSFLDDKLHTREDITEATNLVSELQDQCCNLDQNLIDLNRRLESRLFAYVSHSDKVDGLFKGINAKLSDLGSSTCVSGPSLDGGKGEVSGRAEQISGEKLPALAKEVARVETVRAYAEAALKLDSLVGDIEDAVSSVMNRNLRKHPTTQSSEELRVLAIESLKSIEDILTSITKTRPQWTRLISAVDHRVDRALAILRPQAIADHRALLTSLKWPPPLFTLNPETMKPSEEAPNPLFTMQGDLKHHYCENFLSLCNLQELQRRRKSRQIEGYNRETPPLWVIEELVNPISISSQRHFSKWIDKPELIFTLVYKITKDYVDSMDELLQPLVDKAMLVGYSCREEWVSAMVISLSTYLAKEIFPIYIEERETNRISWLHLVDLMIGFDKRVQSLVERSGILLEEDGNLQKISSLSVFCDRPDWLDLWAELELEDCLNKLKLEIEGERSWIVSGSEEEFKTPAISGGFLRRLSYVVERCKSLPSSFLRSRFLKLVGGPIIRKFLDCLFLRCQEAEGLTALTDDEALIKVTSSINAGRHFESVLKEWCEDSFFLEMESGIFDEEIEKLDEFRTEWVEKITTVVLRGFDARCRDYLKNKKQWQEKGEEGWNVSKSFVTALDYLQGKVLVIEGSLNGTDFVRVWRSLASGVDKLIFNGVVMGNAKFYDGGVERFGSDFEVLVGVFGNWCLRPEGFFPKTNEGLKVLKMGDKVGGEKWLKENGIRHLSVGEAEKIAKSRIFKS